MLDLATQEGVRIAGLCKARIEELSAQLTAVEMTEKDTHITRGKIAELKRLLAQRPALTTVPSYSNPGRKE